MTSRRTFTGWGIDGLRKSLGIMQAACSLALMATGCGTTVNGETSTPSTQGNMVTAVRTTNAVVQMQTSAPQKTSTWPTVRVRSSGATLSTGMQGIALAANATQIVGVGGYTGVVSMAKAYTVWPHAANYATLPMRLHDAAAGYIGRDLYVFGGGQNDSYDTILRIQADHAQIVGKLPRPLSDAVCVPWTQAGKAGLLLIGGYDGLSFHTDAQFYTVQAGVLRAQTLFIMPTGLRYVAATVVDGKLVLVGGQTANNGLSKAVYTWSQAAGVRRVASLPVGIEKAALFAAPNGEVVLAGGRNAQGQASTAITAIRLTDGTTHNIGALPQALYDMGYVQVGWTGFMAGGATSRALSPQVIEVTLK